MLKPAIPSDEVYRLEALKSYAILDTVKEKDYDDIAKLAAQIAGTPISLISFIDEERQWIKSNYGLAINEIPRDFSFCAHTINLKSEVFVIEDTLKDSRFLDNALMINQLNIIFYAGIPIYDADGYALGTLSLMDYKPQKIGQSQIDSLVTLSNMIAKLLELRKKNLTLNQGSGEKEEKSLGASMDISELVKAKEVLKLSKEKYKEDALLFKSILESPQDIIIFALDSNYCYSSFTNFHKLIMMKIWGIEIKIGMNMLEIISIEEDRIKAKANFDKALKGDFFTLEEEYGDENLLRKAYQNRYSPVKDANGIVVGLSVFVIDISKSKQIEDKLQIMKFAIDVSQDIVFWINKDGSFYDVSKSACEKLGYSRNELLKMAVPDIDPIYIAEYWPIHWEDLKLSKSLTFESVNRTKFGTLIQTEVNANYVEYKGQEFNCAFVRDISERKKAEKEIEFERSEKEALINSTTDLIWSIDSNYLLVAANDSFLNTIKNRTSVELKKGQNVLLEIYPPEILRFWKSNYDIALQGEKVVAEFLFDNKDASKTLWYEVNHNPIFKEGKVIGVSCFAKDITKQKNAQEEIRKSNEMLHFIEENSSDGFAVFEGLKTIYVSSTLKKLFKISTDEVFVEDIFKLIDPRDRERIIRELEDHRLNNSNKWLSYAYRIKIGDETKWFEDSIQRLYHENGEYSRTIVNSRDITNRKLAELELVKTKEVLEETNRIAKIGGWDYDAINKKITFSKVAREIFEVDDDYILNLQNAFDFFLEGENREKKKAAFALAIEKGTSFDLELQACTSKGREVWLRTIGKVSFDSGICESVYGAIQDITDRKQENKDLQELVKVTSDQSKRFQNFAYIVSHNIRSHASNFTSLLNAIDTTTTEAEKQMFFELLRPCANNLEETIQNLNEIISIQTNANLQKVEINIKAEIQKTMQIISALIEETKTSVQIEVNDFQTIYSISAYVESILLNLMTNAIKYRRPGLAPIIHFSTALEGNFIVLKCKDNGLGIDLEKFGKRIFGMYKTFHGNQDAKGMGLFLVKEQVEAMNGKIELESEVNIGSTFSVYFVNEK